MVPPAVATHSSSSNTTVAAAEAAHQLRLDLIRYVCSATSGAQRQLFEQAKSMVNYQYLVGDLASNEVVVVDGAWDPEGIRRFVRDAGLKLVGECCGLGLVSVRGHSVRAAAFVGQLQYQFCDAATLVLNALKVLLHHISVLL